LTFAATDLTLCGIACIGAENQQGMKPSRSASLVFGRSHEQHLNVIAGSLQASRLFERCGLGLMRRLIERRGESEEFAASGFIDSEFLIVCLHGSDANSAEDDSVRRPARFTDLENTLMRSKGPAVNVNGEHGSLVIVRQRKERNTFENFRIHGMAASFKLAARS
jgi:hypothetical protein